MQSETSRLTVVPDDKYWIVKNNVAILIDETDIISVKVRRLKGRVYVMDDLPTYALKSEKYRYPCWDDDERPYTRVVTFTDNGIEVFDYLKSSDTNGSMSVTNNVLVQITKKLPFDIAPVFDVSETGTRLSRVQALDYYMAELAVPRNNRYLVYAFPGSGKTTWSNKMVKAVGYKAADTDDFQKIFEGQTDNRKYHQIAFHSSTVYNPQTPNVLLTNYHADLFLAYARKNGFTLIAVKLDDDVWKKRFAERDDLQKMSVPWAKWRKEVDYSRFDLIVNDFDVLNDIICTPLQFTCYGIPPTITKAKALEPLQKPLEIRNDFGHFVRKSIMLWVKNKKRKYVGLGDEIESVIDAKEIGVEYEAVGIPASVPRDSVGEEALSQIKRMNFYDLKLEDDAIYVALWSISNTMNRGFRHDMKFFEHNDAILMYPNLCVYNKIPYGYGNDYVDDGVLTSLRDNGNRKYTDRLEHPNIALSDDKWAVFTIRDFLVYINHDITGKYQGVIGRFLFSNMYYMLCSWFIAIKKTLLSDVNYQTWWNSQTHEVRKVSIPIRRILAVDSHSLHAFRRLALKRLYPDCVTIEDDRVNGYIMVDGKKQWVAVSGHLMNMLLYSEYGLIDFSRYLDTIEENVKAYSIQGRMDTTLKLLYSKELLAEDNTQDKIRRLWHSYYDFYVAVCAYMMLCQSLRMHFNPRATRYVLRRLNVIKLKYPKFIHMGWQAVEFSKKHPQPA